MPSAPPDQFEMAADKTLWKVLQKYVKHLLNYSRWLTIKARVFWEVGSGKRLFCGLQINVCIAPMWDLPTKSVHSLLCSQMFWRKSQCIINIASTEVLSFIWWFFSLHIKQEDLLDLITMLLEFNCFLCITGTVTRQCTFHTQSEVYAIHG